MRLIFGVVSLLIVLAIVGTVGKKQFEALGLSGTASTRAVAPGGAAAGAQAAPVQGTVAEQSSAIQNNMRSAVNDALQKGAERNAQQAQ
jgi:hypothetical protein